MFFDFDAYEWTAIIENDLIAARETLTKLRNDIRYYHADDNDPGMNVIETIDEFMRYSDMFKKEVL